MRYFLEAKSLHFQTSGSPEEWGWYQAWQATHVGLEVVLGLQRIYRPTCDVSLWHNVQCRRGKKKNFSTLGPITRWVIRLNRSKLYPDRGWFTSVVHAGDSATVVYLQEGDAPDSKVFSQTLVNWTGSLQPAPHMKHFVDTYGEVQQKLDKGASTEQNHQV